MSAVYGVRCLCLLGVVYLYLLCVAVCVSICYIWLCVCVLCVVYVCACCVRWVFASNVCGCICVFCVCYVFVLAMPMWPVGGRGLGLLGPDSARGHVSSPGACVKMSEPRCVTEMFFTWTRSPRDRLWAITHRAVLTMCRAANTPSTMAQQNAATTPKLRNTMAATN